MDTKKTPTSKSSKKGKKTGKGSAGMKAARATAAAKAKMKKARKEKEAKEKKEEHEVGIELAVAWCAALLLVELFPVFINQWPSFAPIGRTLLITALYDVGVA